MERGRTARPIIDLQRNWYLPVTALAFFFLLTTRDLNSVLGMLAAVTMFVLAAMLCDESILARCRQAAPWCHVLAAGTALALCIQEYRPFYSYWYDSKKLAALFSFLPFPVDAARCVGIAAAACGSVFVYLCTVWLWQEMIGIFRRTGLLQGVSSGELVVYSILLAVSLLFVTAAFCHSQMFYATEYEYDILYTSDSPALIKGNVYLALFHPENDLRQPLFAVFSAPFLAVPKLLAQLTGATPACEALLLDYVQVAMLLAANFMLARTLELESRGRICFMVLGCCTYTYLLFILMMEQYIVAYFWLVLCLYTICKEGRPAYLALCGAGGTLITSMALLLFAPRKKPWQNFSGWLSELLRGGLCFAAVMLAFDRLDVFLGVGNSLALFSDFGSGDVVTLNGKLLQYIAFCAGCFLSPATTVQTAADGHMTWRLAQVTQVQWIGMVILILAIAGACLCRDKTISRLAAFWIALSVAVLVGFGWGTRENGLNLYSLYFGWAYMVLLFQLAAKVFSRFRSRKLLYAFAVLCGVVMAAVNLPAIKAIVDFAAVNYPL